MRSDPSSLVLKRDIEYKLTGPKDCEYRDVCQYSKRICELENRHDCNDWHIWKGIDLNRLFSEDNNY
jgi:hypothetical protein